MRVTVPSFAKLNLDLRVLQRRPDGYHELRSVFQTISLKDSLQIDWEPARHTSIDLDSSVEIADNLVVRAAKLVLDRLKVKAAVRFQLKKQIPMGAGMGGGSSNAAATLIALPALAGKPLAMSDLSRLAENLGSDVPFFLYGGTALGISRGSELYPLPDLGAQEVVVIAPKIHVSTADAYRSLGRGVTNALTSEDESLILREFQTIAWAMSGSAFRQLPLKNDFEPAVFEAHPALRKLARKLMRLEAKPVLMTGSGSAIFGIFGNKESAQQAPAHFPGERVFAVRFVSRREYRAAWRRALGPAAQASCFHGLA